MKRMRIWDVGVTTLETRKTFWIQPPAVPDPSGPTLSTRLQEEPPLLEISITKTSAFGAAPYVFPDKRIQLQYTTTSPKLHKVLGVETPSFDD